MNHGNNNFGPLLKDIAWGVRHDAFDSPVGRSLLQAYSVGAADDQIVAMIQGLVRPLQVQELFGQLMQFRKPSLHKGEIVLGFDCDRRAIRVFRRWLGAGLLLVSNTGGGKTNLAIFVILQIIASGCRVWFVEMYKSQMRHLRRVLCRRGIDLVILRPSDWKFNLLQSFTRDPRIHLSIAVDLLVRLLDLPPRARSILNQGCHELYLKFGIWDGQKDHWPCLFDLYEWVRGKPRLNVPAREAILDRLASLLLALTWKCAAYRYAWNPSDLARHSVVFEMRGASEIVKQVLLEPTLYALFLHEIERGVVNQPMDLFVVLDDAQRLLDSNQRIASGEIAAFDELAGIIRGSAKGLGIAAQTTQGLSPRLLPNLATKICGRLGSQEDFSFVSGNFALTPQQLDWVRLRLTPGTFIAQVSEGDWREPFVFQVPLLDIPNVVDDLQAAESVKALAHLRTVPADEFENWQPRHLVEPASNVSSTVESLSEVELRFIEAVVQLPGKPSSVYAKKTHLNGAAAAAVRARLVTLGYLGEHELATGRRGRMSIVLEPLDKAFRALSEKAKQDAL